MTKISDDVRGSGAHTAIPAAGRIGSHDEELSLLGLANTILRQQRLIVAMSGLGLVLAVTIFLMVGRSFEAQSTFTPQSGSGGDISRFAGLAAQFGFNLGGSSSGESLDFYVELLKSRELLEAVALTEYRFTLDEKSGKTLQGTLIELYDVDGDTPELRLREATDRLAESISASANHAAQIVTVRTRAPWRELSVQINQRVLDLIAEFNLEKRQTRAAEERRFVETRLAEAERELRAAEAELQEFLEQNRRRDGSPQLAFEQSRLQRRVDLRQQVYGSLAQAYEQARIEEVRNTPVITIIDSPERSARAVGGLGRTGLAGLVVGGMLAVLIAFGREYVDRERVRRPEEFQEFDVLRRRALAQVLRAGPLRRIMKAERKPAPSDERPRQPHA